MPVNSISILNKPAEILDSIAAKDHLCKQLLPERHFHPLLAPVPARILMVTDATGGFNDRSFGLSVLITILTETSPPWVRPVITTAHRDPGDTSSHIPGFTFTRELLSDFDQVWLFGVETGQSYLSEAELRAVSEFMDDGGGVFATGDHENLGQALCSRVPRVRNMRAWYWDTPGPNGEPVAPGRLGVGRHDTLTRRGNETINFDHQSDDVPQRIQPVMFARNVGGVIRELPHEILDSPMGTIDVMPDHPHEGECYEPADLDLVFTFDGATFQEYPLDAGGIQPTPQVISHSQHTNRAAGDEKEALNPKTFGSIAVYDGHLVGVGRVLTDSTWHHFFDVNLRGEPTSMDAVARLGFTRSERPEAIAQFELIKTYYRNIVMYLSRSDQQAQMRTRALWFVRFDHRVAMDLNPQYIEGLDEAAKLKEFALIGKVADKVLQRYASQSQIAIWTANAASMPVSSAIPLHAVDAGRNESVPADLREIVEPSILGAAIFGAARALPGYYRQAAVEGFNEEQIARELTTSATEAFAAGLRFLQVRGQANRDFTAQLMQEANVPPL